MPVPILLYHQIALPPGKPMPFRSMFVHPDTFHRQMTWLKRLGYQGLSLREAVPYIAGSKKGRVVALTFDDGFTNVLNAAAPILQHYGFTATNFIVANQVGGSNVWDQPLGIVHTPCMDVAQLQRWIALGHEVGAHTLDHVRLDQAPDKEAFRQIGQSRDALKSLLATDITSFAYPYGRETAVHRAMAREAGYSWAVTTERGNAGLGDDPFGLPRKTIRRSDILLKFLARVLT